MSKQANGPQTALFQTVRRSHDGYDRTEIRPAPDVVVPPRRKGKAREDATATRDAAYASHRASGAAATQRERLLRYYAEAEPKQNRRGLTGLTDKEAVQLFRRDGHTIDRTSINGRRNELIKHAPPLVERAGAQRTCAVTKNTAQPWRLNAAGWAVVEGLEA